MGEANKTGRRGRGRPNADDAIDDAAVLRCGLETFAELGFDGTTMRALATRLGVSHNFIHDRYGSKERFWQAVVDESLGPVQQGFMQALGALYDDEMDRLTAVIRFVVTRADPLFHRMMTEEARRESPRLTYVVERYLQPMFVGLTPVLASLTRAGRIRPVPWSVLLFLMSGPAQVHENDPISQVLPDPVGAWETDSGEFFTSLILNALRPPAGERAPEASPASRSS